MQVQNVNYQNNYNKSNVKMGPKNIPYFTGGKNLGNLGDIFIKTGENGLQLPTLIEKLKTPLKKGIRVDLKNVVIEGKKGAEVLIDKNFNPLNLLLKDYGTILIKEGANISGKYAAEKGCIEFNGILEKNGKLIAPEGSIAIFNPANIEGKIIAGDLRLHGGVGKNGVEIKAASVTIGEDPFTKKGCKKLKGPLDINADRVYIEKGIIIPKGSVIKADVIEVQPGSKIEAGVSLECNKLIMMGETSSEGVVRIKCDDIRNDKTPSAAELEEIRKENEAFLANHP